VAGAEVFVFWFVIVVDEPSALIVLFSVESVVELLPPFVVVSVWVRVVVLDLGGVLFPPHAASVAAARNVRVVKTRIELAMRDQPVQEPAHVVASPRGPSGP
jgi:hypothetical protein